jgi:hypothetical protein
MNSKNTLDRLPEVYQPIYKNPHLSKHSSRKSTDRLNIIKDITQKYSNKNSKVINL